MKKLASLAAGMAVALGLLSFASCSDSDHDYSGDTYYQAPYGRRVAAICTKTTSEGQPYVWEYRFEYDREGRIHEIEGSISYPTAKYGTCNVTTEAEYKYTGINTMLVKYSLKSRFPAASSQNYEVESTYGGYFNEDGTLNRFGAISCDYTLRQLSQVALDGGESYCPLWSDGDVTGYSYQASGSSEAKSCNDVYAYTGYSNNTAFDFASFMNGYPYELAALPAGGNILFSPFYLGAFEMMGSGSKHLPQAQYEFDGKGSPVTIRQTTASGLTLTRTVTYAD